MDIRVPEVGESVRQALLAKWLKKSGDHVRKDEPVCEIETDKITLDLHAESDGVLETVIAEGTTVAVGTIVGRIEKGDRVQQTEPPGSAHEHVDVPVQSTSPSVRSRMREEGITPESVNGSGRGGRITLDDLFSRIESNSRRTGEGESVPDSSQAVTGTLTYDDDSAPVRTAPVTGEAMTSRQDSRVEERKPMSPLRIRISERLLAVRQQTAMLTTFNEADMSRIMALRGRFRDRYRSLHGVSPGLIPFFVKASVEALREYPLVNACIDGDDIVYHRYYDIGIAVAAEKGLVVPVLRNAERMRYSEIDLAIAAFREKISANRLAISDLTGGTFTITNGGIFGSMLSTPILNPPQSAVLGMHAIQDRPVARDGQVVIRPMMYLALSYDHRLIDGREAVGFLKRVKELVEEPEELLLEG